MKRILVHYYLYRPSVEFQCPFCHRTFGRPGEGRIIGGQLTPEANTVVFHHVRGCPKLAPDDRYEVETVLHPPVED